jgi:hypothetical protein
MLAAVAPVIAANAEPSERPAYAGDIYEIVRTIDSSQNTADGSSGSSRAKDTLIEHVISVRDDGLELEYDLPKAATAEDRARSWQFPVRVSKPVIGQMKLLNGPELERRIDGWLKNFKVPRTACGHWIFTWNAFRIECDPQSVIQTLAQFDLRPGELRDGVVYQDSMALAPSPMSQSTGGSDGSSFTVQMIVDPEIVRRKRAQSDVVVAELSGKTLAFDLALGARSAEIISGTVTVSFDVDSSGQVRSRTRVTTIEIKGVQGKSEAQSTTERIERRLIDQ